MLIILKSLLMLCLLVIVYQDFKTRAIYWWLPVLVFGLSCLVSGMYGDIQAVLTNTLANLCFLLLLLSVVVLYFFIRYKTIRSFISEQFGLGDILLLIAICPLLSPPNFILFICGSNILMVLIEILKRLGRATAKKTVPYAGYLGLFLSACILLTFCIPNINFLADFSGYFLFSATP